MTRKVVVIVKEVRGFCRAGLKVGDRCVVEDANILVKESSGICGSAFSAMYPKIYSLGRGSILHFLETHMLNVPIQAVGLLTIKRVELSYLELRWNRNRFI